MQDGNVQGRVAVCRTLPLGVNRTAAERSRPSGSATGTLEVEWQCSLHCHSAVNVQDENVQDQVAVWAGMTCFVRLRSRQAPSVSRVGVSVPHGKAHPM